LKSGLTSAPISPLHFKFDEGIATLGVAARVTIPIFNPEWWNNSALRNNA
jgi:hypothetical protein